MRRAIFALALCLPGLAGAQVYRCVDAHGRVHYVQTLPKDGSCSQRSVVDQAIKRECG